MTQEVIARARRLIIQAKAHRNVSWDLIFRAHELDFQELKRCLRRDLAISPKALTDFDMQVLFRELDSDKSGTVNIKEMLDYVAHGPKRVLARHSPRHRVISYNFMLFHLISRSFILYELCGRCCQGSMMKRPC